ncbi:MAG: methylcrotonoyl-CoA carboxylase, partial [Bdellovibrionales bacterium]|nr:methylcrotonoyl-CoA carboxylase [Bdellovibrionales bacterium]
KGQTLTPEEQEEIKKPILEKYAEESSAYYSSARLWDDGIIDPKDSRKVLALGLSASFNREWESKKKGVFRM